jgi:hypothetical protein
VKQARKLRDRLIGKHGDVRVLTRHLRLVGFPVPDGSDHAAVVSAPELVKHCEARLSGSDQSPPAIDTTPPDMPGEFREITFEPVTE